MCYLIARIKSVFRFAGYLLGAEYKEYGTKSNVPGYDGWHEWRGRVVAFRRDDGTNQYCW